MRTFSPHRVQLFYVLVLTLLWTGIQKAKSQSEMDSLKNLLAVSREGTNRVRILYGLSQICREDSIAYYANRAYGLAVKLKDKKGEADALGNKTLFAGKINRAGP